MFCKYTKHRENQEIHNVIDSFAELRTSLNINFDSKHSPMSLLSILLRFMGSAQHFGAQNPNTKKSTNFSEHLRSDHDIGFQQSASEIVVELV